MSQILFFDGACNLCNGVVRFLVKQKPPFSFASLQGTTAQGIVPEDLRHELSSLVYYRDGELWTQADALRRVFEDLGGKYKFMALLGRGIPDFAVNSVYQGIAKSRYRVFGKRDHCEVGDESSQSYFLP